MGPKGSHMGFLKGSLEEKMGPWVQQQVSYLRRFMGSVAYEEYKKAGKIKYGCIEMLRSLNLDRSFIILDEAQNLDESTLTW